MTEVIQETAEEVVVLQPTIVEPTADDIFSQPEKQKLFYSYSAMLDWVTWARPSQFNMRSGVIAATPVWEVQYMNSNGD